MDGLLKAIFFFFLSDHPRDIKNGKGYNSNLQGVQFNDPIIFVLFFFSFNSYTQIKSRLKLVRLVVHQTIHLFLCFFHLKCYSSSRPVVRQLLKKNVKKRKIFIDLLVLLFIHNIRFVFRRKKKRGQRNVIVPFSGGMPLRNRKTIRVWSCGLIRFFSSAFLPLVRIARLVASSRQLDDFFISARTKHQ